MLVPHGLHVMVVDGEHMRLFRNDATAAEPRLSLVEERVSETERTSSIGEERPGRVFQSADARRSAHEAPDLHARAEERFAASAAARLNQLLHDGSVRAALVAAPRTLGHMRAHLEPQLRERLACEIAADWTARGGDELCEMLVRHRG